MTTRWPAVWALAILTAVIAVAACQSHSTQRLQDLPPDAFQRVVVDLLRERFPTRTFVASSDPHEIKMDERYTLGLTNVRAIVNSQNGTDEDGRRAIVEFFTKTIANADAAAKQPQTPDTWDEVKPLIRPQLVGAQFHEQQAVKAGIVARRLIADIYLTYVVDRPDTMMYVRQDDVARWRATVEALHTAALENLDKAAAADAPLDVRPAEGANARGTYTIVFTNDGYSAARLVLPAFKARLRKALGDGYRVVMPTRDSLVAWSSDFTHARELTAGALNDARKNAYPLSEHVLTIVGDELRESP